mmetsp:Transcript_112417/g.363012  ORF Transcript_112417/g.363012 Transcript_112417/m.363012 type:complete len:201 (-) Transcript_112417:344-946(-)
MDAALEGRQGRYACESAAVWLAAAQSPQGLGALEALVHILELLVLRQTPCELADGLGELGVPAKGPDAPARGDPHVVPRDRVGKGHAGVRHALHVRVVRVRGEVQALVGEAQRAVRRGPVHELRLAALREVLRALSLRLVGLGEGGAGGGDEGPLLVLPGSKILLHLDLVLRHSVPVRALRPLPRAHVVHSLQIVAANLR